MCVFCNCSLEEIPPEHKTTKFPPRPTALPPPLVRNDISFGTRFKDFKDAKDAGLKACLAIAASQPSLNPWLAPRKDIFFKRQVKKALAPSGQQNSFGQNQAKRCWAVREEGHSSTF